MGFTDRGLHHWLVSIETNQPYLKSSLIIKQHKFRVSEIQIQSFRDTNSEFQRYKFRVSEIQIQSFRIQCQSFRATVSEPQFQRFGFRGHILRNTICRSHNFQATIFQSLNPSNRRELLILFK